MTIKQCKVFLLIIFSATLFASFGTEEKIYLSKTYIDTMVQNAYFQFVAAAEYKHNEGAQESAIANARRVASRLKREAVNDPNSHYILWRVNELEHQIFLEEEELSLKKRYRMQKAMNVLVDKFNGEVGKRRPNFVNLIAIHASMLDLSAKKGNELAYLIEDRSRNITREVSYILDKSLLLEEYEKANQEFEYIRNNRKYLGISNSRYTSFEKRIRAKEEADHIVANINTYFNELKSVIKKDRIAEGKRMIESLQSRIDAAGELIPLAKRNGFRYKIGDFMSTLLIKEDSLVNESLALLEQQRIDEALDYIEKVLRKHGVSHEKILMVDNMIIQGMKQGPSAVDRSVSEELRQMESDETSNIGLDFSGVQARMKQKTDSLSAIKAEEQRLARIEYEKQYRRELEERRRNEEAAQKNRDKARIYTQRIYLLLEKNKPKKAMARFKSYEKPLKRYLSPDVFACLRDVVVDANKPSSQKNELLEAEKSRAKNVAVEVFSLIEQENPDGARNLFQQNRDLLKKSLNNVDFSTLERSVVQAYALVRQKERESVSPAVEPQPTNKVSQPQSTPTPQSSAPIAVQPSSNIDAYAEFDAAKNRASQEANQDIENIYILLEENNIKGAFEYFKRKQILLKKYVIPDAYKVLETTVLEAYNAQYGSL